MSNDIVYKYKNNLYINITNRCPVKCLYCIKYRWKLKFRSYNLELKKDPSIEEIIKDLKKQISLYKDIKEIVFCGYGEPLLRWRIVKEASLWIKNNYPKIKIRVNTNGLASAYNKIDICRELKGLIDIVSISLNAHNEKVYKKLHRTKIKQPFKQIINFIKQAKKYFSKVIITTILHPEINKDKIKEIAKKLKVNFREREYLIEYEDK